MARYWIDFHKLRGELSFEKILEQYQVKCHRKGDQATGPCPLPGHTGERKTDSFSANIPKGIFQCFSCGAKGNLFDFAILMEGRHLKNSQDLRQTAIDLAKRYGLQHVGSEQKSRQAQKPASNGGNPPPPPAPKGNAPTPEKIVVNAPLGFELSDLDGEHPYLTERGFSLETIKHFGMGFCQTGRFTGRIAIPIHSEKGVLLGYAGRLIDETAITAENPRYLFPGRRIHQGTASEFKKSLILYNAHRLKAPVENLILVEGFTAVWWLTQNGFPNCVALMGSSMSEDQAKLAHALVGDQGHITAFTDGDAPGMRCADEIRAKLGDGITIHRPEIKLGAQPTDFTKAEIEGLISKTREKCVNQLVAGKAEKICGLIREFPSLAQYEIAPWEWNAEGFDARSLSFPELQRSAAQFVLSVWDRNKQWKCGRFDVVEAAARLDDVHRKVIEKWLREPWKP